MQVQHPLTRDCRKEAPLLPACAALSVRQRVQDCMHPLHFLLRSFGIVQFLRLLQRGRSAKVLISRVIA